jgi:hypothetical protein
MTVRRILFRILIAIAVVSIISVFSHAVYASTTIYVEIIVQNSQSIPTPPNFDLFLNISQTQVVNALSTSFGSSTASTLWSNAESNYFLNVLFELPNGQPLYAWVMNFTSSWVAVWVKIPSGIPANSQFTILMVFTSSNEYPYTGVNPYIYGSQTYDNGPSVFAAYGYFNNQVPSGWTKGTYYGSFSPTTTTSGLEMINNAGNEGTYAYASIPNLGNYTVIVMWWYSGSADALQQELYGNPSTLSLVDQVGGTTTAGGETPYAKAGIADQNEFYSSAAYIRDANGVVSTSFAGSYVVTYFAVQYHQSTGSASEWFGYRTVTSPFRLALPSSFTSFTLSFNVNSTNQPTVFIGAGTGGAYAYIYLDWVFVIPTPPNNVMPSIVAVDPPPIIIGTVYFEGVYPSSTGSLGYQSINVNAILTCNGTHITYTSVSSVSITCYFPSIYVNGLPNGWAPDVWDSTVGAWSYEYNYTISNNGTYYLVTATELVQLASPPVSQLPYEAIVVEMTNSALVTSLPTLYLITNSTGVYSPLFGGCCGYLPGAYVASPYYYATSSGAASGPSTGYFNDLPYGIAYWVVAADTNSIPFILGFDGAFSEDLMFPELVNGVYFYAPSPTSYGSAYLPANSSKIINAPVTFQVQFYVSSSSASGVLLEEENNYYPNGPSVYAPIVWLNGGTVYAYLGGSCGTATQVTTVTAGNTYTITLYWDPANNTGEAYINGVEVAKSTGGLGCSGGYSEPYIAVGDGYTGGWSDTNGGWFPLSGVQIYYVAIWYNQLSDTAPSGNPTFIYEPSLVPNTDGMVFGGSTSDFSLIPGQPVYLGTYNSVNGYEMNPFEFEYVEGASSTPSFTPYAPVVISTGLQPSVNPPPSIQFIWLSTSGPNGAFYYWLGGSSGFDYVGGVSGFFKNGQTAIIGFRNTQPGDTIPGIVTDSFNVTAVDLYPQGAPLPSNTFAYYIPEIDFIQPGQVYYLYIPQSGVGYIGLNYMTSNIVSEDFTRACQPTNTIPSLGTTTFQWYWLNGIAWTQQSGGGPGTWWWGVVNSGPNQGFLIINGSNVLFIPILNELNVSSIAAWSNGSSVSVDLSVTSSGQPIWLAPLYLVFAYSGQYVYGLYANAIEVEPNYESYSITLPTCLANNPVTVTAYSVPTQEITSLLLTLTNPLNIILGATTVTPYPVPNNVTVSSSGTPPTTSNTTSSSVPVIQIGATQQPVVLPWWGTTLQSFIQINLATPIGIIGVGLIFGLLAYYWRTNRSGLLALAGGGIALFIIGAALSSIDLVALGLFITMVSIAAFYVKRG